MARVDRESGATLHGRARAGAGCRDQRSRRALLAFRGRPGGGAPGAGDRDACRAVFGNRERQALSWGTLDGDGGGEESGLRARPEDGAKVPIKPCLMVTAPDAVATAEEHPEEGVVRLDMTLFGIFSLGTPIDFLFSIRPGLKFSF